MDVPSHTNKDNQPFQHNGSSSNQRSLAHSPSSLGSMPSIASVASLASLQLSSDTETETANPTQSDEPQSTLPNVSNSSEPEQHFPTNNEAYYSDEESTNDTESSSDSDDDPLGITQLNHDFEQLVDKIGTRVQALADQALKSAQYQAHVITQQISGPDEPLSRRSTNSHDGEHNSTTNRDNPQNTTDNSTNSSNNNINRSSTTKNSSSQSPAPKSTGSSIFSLSKPSPSSKNQPLAADVEIHHLQEIMKQCDAFEMDFMRLRQIADIVKEFRERIEVIETFMGP